MANCSIIRNPNTNYIEKVLAPNGKESLLYKRALEHLRDVKDDVIVNRSTNENEFLFQENGVTVTLKRRDGSDVYLEQINSESDFSTENVFKRVLDFFDKQGVTLFVDKNNTFSEKLIVNSGFVENQEQPFSLIREREEFKAIPSEQLKEQALTLWSIAYTDAFSETIGKWNFTEEELAKEKSFINQRKREIKQVRAYNAAKSQIIAERYQNLQKQGAQYQVLNDNLNNEELFDSEIIKEQQKLQNEVLNRIQEVFSKKFHNFNIVRDINSFSKLLEDDNLLKTYSGKVIGAVLDDGTVFIDKNNFSIETPIHEASHLWEKLNPQLWEKGVETLKEALPKNKELQDIINFVKNNQTHLSEEQVYSEALNDFIGKWGEKKINENNGDLKKLLNWLKDFFNDIFKLFNPEINEQKRLEDFSTMVVAEMVGGKKLQTFFDNSLQNQNKDVILPSESSIKSIVAPYFKRRVRSEAELIQIVHSEDFQNFLDRAREIAKELGLPEFTYHINLGGYSFDDGVDSIQELSVTFNFEGVTKEQIRLFTDLMGDVRLEFQEAVITSRYVDEYNQEEGGFEFSLNVNGVSDVMEITKKVGLKDFSYDTETRTLKVLEFPIEDNEEARATPLILRDFIKEYNKYIKDEKSKLNEGSVVTKFFDSYFDVDSDRRERYKKRISEGGDSDINSSEREIIERAIRRNNEGKPYEKEYLDTYPEVLKPQFLIVGEENMSKEDAVRLQIAKRMKSENRSEKDIWTETGWQYTNEGWKTEIPDGNLRTEFPISSEDIRGFDNKVDVTFLTSLVDNQSLWYRYPSLMDTQVVFYKNEKNRKDSVMAFNPNYNTIEVNLNKYEGLYKTETNERGGEKGRFLLDMESSDRRIHEPNENDEERTRREDGIVDKFRNENFQNEKRVGGEDVERRRSREFFSDLMHEVQHIVQEIEGFEGGNDPYSIENKLNRLRDIYTLNDERKEIIDKGLKSIFGKSFKLQNQNISNLSMDIYLRSKGEVEARNVQKRAFLTLSEKQKKPLKSTEDISDNKQINGNLVNFELKKLLDKVDTQKEIPERFQLSVEEIFGYNTEDLKPIPVLSVSKYLEDIYETDNNGEPHLKDVLVMDTIMRNWKAAVTPAEIYKLSNDFGDVVDSIEELYQEINKTFFPNGYFQIKEDLLFESKLYSQGEAILLLTHPEIQQNVQRLFEAVRKEYMSNNTYLENTLDNSKFSEELVQYKDEVDDLGKVQKEDPVEVENYLKQNLAGVKDRQLFNMIVSNLQEYPSFKKRFTNDLAFSETVFDKYSKMNKVIRFQDIKGQITPRIKGNRFATMFETLQFSDKGLEVGQDSKFLRRLDNFIWETQSEEIKSLLQEIEEKLIDYNIDVIGLSEQYDKKSKTEILDFIDNIYNFTEKLRSNDYITEDIQTLSYDIDSFFGKDSVNTDSFYLKVSENNREKTLVELSSEKSDLELFEEQNLIKTSDGFYQKVNVKPTLEEAYDDAVQIIIDNPKIINNYFLKGLPFFKNGMFNRTEVQKSENRELIKDAFKNFIRQEASKLNDPVVKKLTETAQKWTIYKLMNKNPLNTEKLPNFAKEQLKYQMFNGNYHYLTNNFHSDFQNYILKNKFENTSLYNNILKYFEVTESGIRLTTDSSQIKDRIRNTYITDSIFENLKQYSILSKHPSMQDLFEYENDGIRNNSAVEFERFYNSNNFSQMKSFKGDYRVDGDILVANNVSDNFIRVAEGLFEKVGQIEGNSVYGRQTVIENPNVNNYEYKLQHPNIDFEIARSMVLKTNAVESKSIKSYDKQEETILKQEYNECG